MFGPVEFDAVELPNRPVAMAAMAKDTRELIFGGIEIDGEVEWTWQGATVVRPGVASIAEALEAGYELRGNPKQREMALRGAAEYAVDNVVAKYWTPVLTDMAARRLEALCASA